MGPVDSQFGAPKSKLRSGSTSRTDCPYLSLTLSKGQLFARLAPILDQEVNALLSSVFRENRNE
jgi:hypothetical protein